MRAPSGAPPAPARKPWPSPARAAGCALLLPGLGQLYNRQLEKAVLFWLSGALLGGVGLLLLAMGLLERLVPRGWARPPLGDVVAEHAGAIALAWGLAALALWLASLLDAWRTARAIREGRVVIRYPLRRQIVHLLASQALGMLPIIGLLFPPGVVAEALDAARERRRPDRKRLLEEGRQALLEWALVRLAVAVFVALAAGWALWWGLRAAGLAP